MKRITRYFLITVAVLGIAFITKPSESKHRSKLTNIALPTTIPTSHTACNLLARQVLFSKSLGTSRGRLWQH